MNRVCKRCRQWHYTSACQCKLFKVNGTPVYARDECMAAERFVEDCEDPEDMTVKVNDVEYCVTVNTVTSYYAKKKI